MARDTERLASGLRAYLDRGRGITGVKTLSAGHSNETYLVEGLQEILRMPPSEEGLLPPYDMARQHAILSAVKAHAPAVPLPGMLELCTDPDVIGDPFFLMECVAGEAFEYVTPDWVKADPVAVPESICRQWFDALIGLHTMPVAHMPAGSRTVEEEAQHWLDVAQSAEATQDLIEVLDTLVKHPPRPSGAPTPVHGDPKHGNCLWHEGRLTAFLDWEMSRISEPMLDLGYILMFHDQGDASLADAGFELPGWWSPERMIGEWEKGVGRSAIDAHRYAVLGQAKVAAIIALGAYLFTSGKTNDARFEAFGAVLPAYTKLLVKRAMVAG
ncbi:phosphotransferase family protein [Sphingobium boeckii]|uniref:Aminoglycoside phosphotransferase (APT) family kinase protein n=1 Tax=Sphingobium boeckii TaxID=1082345 RepID=A0A7W9AI08_9SPHN|nr:phosphotransferase family protein [Sphingobium boeckii]MBB5685887.1 aminoglycoside phosphotransferase (APT) family kinase protein [Sphingobium boeckii]